MIKLHLCRNVIFNYANQIKPRKNSENDSSIKGCVKVDDPSIKGFWDEVFAKYSREKYGGLMSEGQEMAAPEGKKLFKVTVHKHETEKSLVYAENMDEVLAKFQGVLGHSKIQVEELDVNRDGKVFTVDV